MKIGPFLFTQIKSLFPGLYLLVKGIFNFSRKEVPTDLKTKPGIEAKSFFKGGDTPKFYEPIDAKPLAMNQVAN